MQTNKHIFVHANSDRTALERVLKQCHNILKCQVSHEVWNVKSFPTRLQTNGIRKAQLWVLGTASAVCDALLTTGIVNSASENCSELTPLPLHTIVCKMTDCDLIWTWANPINLLLRSVIPPFYHTVLCHQPKLTDSGKEKEKGKQHLKWQVEPFPQTT